MDLIFTKPDREELGVLHAYSLDNEANTEPDKCTFQIQRALQDNPLEIGQFWFIDGTEYGGKIDGLKIDTSKATVYASGRTWRGILGSKVLEPVGNYYTVSGDANAILAQIITKTNLGSLFAAATRESKTISHKFKRYQDAYSGIIEMLAKNGLKLTLHWNGSRVELAAEEITDWANEQEMTSDLFDFVIEKNTAAVNHLIGLGQGELAERQVVHRYIDKDGNISTRQYYTGEKEITATYENTNAEDLQALTEDTEDKLKELAIEDGLKITAKNISADIGDSFTAYEVTTGLTAKQYVISKISNITETSEKINYKVGGII